MKVKTLSQSQRVRLSRSFVAVLLAEVSGLSFACFPFGPGLRAYGAGRSRGFRTGLTGMEGASKNNRTFLTEDTVAQRVGNKSMTLGLTKPYIVVSHNAY